MKILVWLSCDKHCPHMAEWVGNCCPIYCVDQRPLKGSRRKLADICFRGLFLNTNGRTALRLIDAMRIAQPGIKSGKIFP